MLELERLRAHASLRTPEVLVFAQMAIGDLPKDDFDVGMFIEICEDNVLIGVDIAEGAVTLASPHCQLLQAANYNREDQIRLYSEFILMVYPALYMSPNIFTQFMQDLGWQKTQCSSLFRAADVSRRGGLSFLDSMLWCAALEPMTQHLGSPAELRCRYIFRQLGLQPSSQVPIADFVRAVAELYIRGTSSLLRSPKSIAGYLLDLHERDREMNAATTSKLINYQVPSIPDVQDPPHGVESSVASGPQRRRDFSIATCVLRLQKKQPPEILSLTSFDEDAVSSSTTRLLSAAVTSMELLGPAALPVEAFALINYFALHIENPAPRRTSGGGSVAVNKQAWAWLAPNEEAAFGTTLLRMAEAIRPICAFEPRLLKLRSPVYVIGIEFKTISQYQSLRGQGAASDLHGNLSALLAMESSLWPLGPSMVPAKLLFLGDYVDRGAYGAELLAYLFAAKLQRPNGVYLVRGNHEARDIQKMFSFHAECLAKYGENEGGRIWNAINQVFDALPLAAVVDDKVFCCHGGIPPPWVCPLMSAIDKVPVPLPRPAEQSSIAWELMWNDPIRKNKITASLALELAANEGFAVNTKRGTGHVFEQAALERFLLANQLSHVVRAHELQQNGFMVQFNGRLVSVFSSSHYCGGTNDSGVALLEDGKLRLIRVTVDL
ncbi:unnamed protein product [Leptosia nina]|uniref:Serine/threonine-protein phosphatase n=1 Tax=Leptosia nina TaxID=320188 RepID=A0AAV1J5X0_9NEOP